MRINVRGAWKLTGTKTCVDCREVMTVDRFYWNHQDKHPGSLCKRCHISRGNKTRREKPFEHRTKVRRKRQLARFGITPDDYERLYREQGETCLLCNEAEIFTNRLLAVDHCHETGKVRGLLCGRCNTGIGMLRESLPLMQRAMEYLRKHGATWS
jgi:hypothetical protein